MFRINPKQTPYYRCVEDQLETLEQVYEDRLIRISLLKDNMEKGKGVKSALGS